VRVSDRTIAWRSAWLWVSRSRCLGSCRLRRPLVFWTLPFCQPAQASKEHAADAGQQAVAGERTAVVDGDRAFELGCRSLEDGHQCGRGLGGTEFHSKDDIVFGAETSGKHGGILAPGRRSKGKTGFAISPYHGDR
jgi:hypothetical protein